MILKGNECYSRHVYFKTCQLFQGDNYEFEFGV